MTRIAELRSLDERKRITEHKSAAKEHLIRTTAAAEKNVNVGKLCICAMHRRSHTFAAVDRLDEMSHGGTEECYHRRRTADERRAAR